MSPPVPRIKMSEYHIPFHIQEEIMKRLPVKSLIQFRSVSKAWKSLTDSGEFIVAHSLQCHTQPKHLLVWIDNMRETPKIVCYIDDDTFPKQRSLLTLPLSYKQLKHPKVLGSSRGLVCVYEYLTSRAILWNPSIRKSIVVDVPKCSCVGFGVCPVTSDPKIIAITQLWGDAKKNIKTNYPCNVMVYTLSSGKWRSLPTNLCVKPLQVCCSRVAAGGFIYWHFRLPGHKTVLSFDVTNELFEEIYLPDIFFPCHHPRNFYLFEEQESLALFEYRGDFCTVSMMEEKVFTKRFKVNTLLSHIVGFRKNGVPIMQVRERDFDGNALCNKLVVYEPKLEHNNVREICKPDHDFNVKSYTETLLLLGRSDCSSK